jgi:hypothetical protein
MEKSDLLKILHGDISHIDRVNAMDDAVNAIEVVVKSINVKHMLLSYLDGKINAVDLTKWACFICFSGSFCSPNYFDDDAADYYEDMFYVIQKLSTPLIDGDVNEASVKLFLTELEKYHDNTD